MARTVLGLDIGGANLKAAHAAGEAASRPFSLWKNPSGLATALRDLFAGLPSFNLLAVTMTGELCDCFETKRHGVCAILDAVEEVAADRLVRVWQTTGCFADPRAAREAPMLTAAANWLALAEFAGRFLPLGAALVIDVGSTTTDVIPLFQGTPVPRARTDPERLAYRELVYTGVRRTPVCAFLGTAGAAEFFATTLDAYLLLGMMPEDGVDLDTADGRPAIRAAAAARLARMVCGDRETIPKAQVLELARRVHELQVQLLRQAVAVVAEQLPEPPRGVLLAGSGEFLARAALRDHPVLRSVAVQSLADTLGVERSRAACAHAVAVLAAEGKHEPR